MRIEPALPPPKAVKLGAFLKVAETDLGEVIFLAKKGTSILFPVREWVTEVWLECRRIIIFIKVRLRLKQQEWL